jgi:uncharacterized repeat protein (TIGR03943 family)
VSAAGGTISMLVGAVLLRLELTGTYERYVRVGMGKWLLVAGIAVIALGAATLVFALRHVDPGDAHDHDEGHEHVHGLGVGWLLLAPIAAILLVAPPTLGAYGVNRSAAIDVRAGKSVFKPLPRASTPHAMTLFEFGERAYDHNGVSFNKATVELTGFVSGDEAGGFRLARYTIACCAADAAPSVVEVTGTVGDTPPLDQWVTVRGTFLRGGDAIPVLAATSVAEVKAPQDPYE